MEWFILPPPHIIDPQQRVCLCNYSSIIIFVLTNLKTKRKVFSIVIKLMVQNYIKSRAFLLKKIKSCGVNTLLLPPFPPFPPPPLPPSHSPLPLPPEKIMPFVHGSTVLFGTFAFLLSFNESYKERFSNSNNETSHCFSHTKAWVQIVKIKLSCKLIFKRVDRAIFTTELTFLGQILKCSETCQLCSRVSNKTDDLTSRVNYNLPWFLEVQKTGASSDDVGLVDTKTFSCHAARSHVPEIRHRDWGRM